MTQNEIDNLELEQEIKQITLQKEDAKTMIALGDLVKELEQTPAYQKVIGERYLMQEPVRLTGLLGEHATQVNPAEREAVIKEIEAIAFFQQFLLLIKNEAVEAQNALVDYERSIAECQHELDISEA